MNTYIAKILGHQSLIFLAKNTNDAIEWADFLKRELYGSCYLTEIWTNGKCVYQRKVPN